MLETGGALTNGDREELGRRWGTFASNFRALLGHDRLDGIEIDPAEYAAVLAALDGNAGSKEIALRVRGWQFETAEAVLTRLAEQTRAVGNCLGKGRLNVVVEPNDVRLLPGAWAEFWSGFTHAIRNAVDHGIEFPDERLAAGKPMQGLVRLTTRLVGGDLFVEIADDGRGVAWELVRERAATAGIAHDTPDDLVQALFQDGLSTKGEISELSGRGIGMGAVRAICQKMGGSVQVISTEGQGTCLRFRWAQAHNRADALVLAPILPAPIGSPILKASEHLQ
jgi:signal transduction histidine kinase